MIINHNKFDARKAFNMTLGYQPGVAFIGKSVVHIENHNQTEILTQCLDNLEEKEVSIEIFRGDSASYQQNIIDLMNSRNIRFLIRNKGCTKFDTICGKVTEWEKIEINYEEVEVASVEYLPFDGDKSYRVVVTRTPRKDRQLDLFN